MIQLTFDMIPRALLVLFIVHIVVFIIDVINENTTYKNMNRAYYWKQKSITGTFLLYMDATICAIVFGVLAAKYILTGNVL